MEKRVYRMSEAGCMRVLSARILGYEPIPRTEAEVRLLKHASRHEGLIVEALRDEGYYLERPVWGREVGVPCPLCPGEAKYGFHVEIETPLIRLIGHLDAVIKANDDIFYPLEIKSLGRFTFEKFRKNRFDIYSEYAGQEACYLKAKGCPGFYVVGNRDTGELLKYSIPYHTEIAELNGFARLDLPITADTIIDRLHQVEIFAQKGELCEGTLDEKSQQCRWCKYRYLCIREEKPIQEVQLPTLVEAAELWKEGKKQEQLAEEMLAQAKATFLNYAKENELSKFSCSGVDIKYHGSRVTERLNEAVIKELVGEDVWRLALKKGKPWDDIRIYILKEE